jgi:hypothetical protein
MIRYFVILLLIVCSCSSNIQKQQDLTEEQREMLLDKELRPVLQKLATAIGPEKSAVVGFYHEGTTQETKLSKYLVPKFQEEFVHLGLQVLERNNLQAILKEQQRELSMFFDPASRKDVGKLVGVDVIVFGYVRSASLNKYQLEIKLEDIETAQIIVNDRVLINRQYLPVRYGGK